jgi:hypothetical protein
VLAAREAEVEKTKQFSESDIPAVAMDDTPFARPTAIRKESIMRRVTYLSIALLLGLALLGGCATQSTSETVNRETVQYPADRAQAPVVVEQRTTEKTETTKSGEQSGGVLSGTVHVVGEVLALPFRAVAGLLGVVF